MAENTTCRQYQRTIHLTPAAFLIILITIAIKFTILPPAATAADGQALKTTIPTAADASAEETAQSADAVARELANPNSSLATLTLKNQYRWYTGDLPGADDQNNFTMLFQPIFPLSLPKDDNGNSRNVFFRPGFPMLFDQPVPQVENGALDWDGVTALGDIGFDIAYGVSTKSGFIWAVGMVGTLPTATDSDVAGKQLRLGPEFILAKFEKWGLYGIFPSHQWNVTGWSDESFNTTQFQPVAQVPFRRWLDCRECAHWQLQLGKLRVDHPDQPECFQDSPPRQDALEVRTGNQLLRRATGRLWSTMDDRLQHFTRRQEPLSEGI